MLNTIQDLKKVELFLKPKAKNLKAKNVKKI